MRRNDGSKARPRLLVLDSSYTIDMIRRLGLEQSVLCRDLDGYFDHVWSVHPFGDINARAAPAGAALSIKLAKRHDFIQAQPGRFSGLKRWFAANFVLGQLSLFWRLRRLVKTQGINLIRAGDPLYIGLFGWALAKATGRPLALRINANNDRIRESAGGPLYPRLLRTIGIEKRIERFVLPRADLIAAPNQDNVDFALANGARPDRVAIFPYGNLLAPAHRLDPARRKLDRALFERLGVEPGGYLLCVSRLIALKFPDDAVRALGAARMAGHDVRLVLAGEGDLRAGLASLADELGVADSVIFAGNLDQAALAQLYANAGAVISPLTGRALSEAALGAAPIVAYDLDWQGDLIRTGKTGELVPFRDQHALGEAVAKLLADRDLARAMGNGARIAALDMFDEQKLIANERAAYSRLLEEER